MIRAMITVIRVTVMMITIVIVNMMITIVIVNMMMDWLMVSNIDQRSLLIDDGLGMMGNFIFYILYFYVVYILTINNLYLSH